MNWEMIKECKYCKQMPNVISNTQPVPSAFFVDEFTLRNINYNIYCPRCARFYTDEDFHNLVIMWNNANKEES